MKEISTPNSRKGSIVTMPAIFSGSDGSLNFSLQQIIDLLVRITENILTYVGIIAVVMIVIAGIILVVNGGNENSRDRARKIIVYTIIGIIVILLASAIVRFVLGIF